MSTKEFIWPIRVYYEDTDASGVVYHANYLRWFERGRTEWLRAQGWGQETLRTEHGIAFTIANLEITYLKPARLDDELEVVTAVTGIRRASLSFSQFLRHTRVRDMVLARITLRVACVDMLNFRPRALPEMNLL